MVGVEPTLSNEKQILSLSCLPVPPHRHILPLMDNICNNKKTSDQIDQNNKSSKKQAYLCVF